MPTIVAMIAILVSVMSFGTALRAQGLPSIVYGATAAAEIGTAVPVAGYFSYRRLSVRIESVWANGYVLFPSLFSDRTGLSTTLGFGRQRLELTGTGMRPLVNPGSGAIDAVLQSWQYGGFSYAWQGDLLAYVRPTSRVRLEAGAWGSYAFMPTYELRDMIVAPDTARYPDGTKERTQSAVDDFDAAVGGVGGMLRVTVEIPYGALSLVPSAHVRLGTLFQANRQNVAAVVGSVGIGFGILFNGPGVFFPDDAPTAAPTLPDSAIVPKAVDAPPEDVGKPLATIDLYGTDRDGRRCDSFLVREQRTLTRIEVPLARAIPFEYGVAILPARYAGRTAATRAEFSEDTFIGAGPDRIEDQSLDVLGMRLAASKSGTIRLIGGSAPGEAPRLAAMRAAAVRAYLEETWGVGARRIRIGSEPGLGSEVRIVPETAELAAPVTAAWVEERFDVPVVGLDPVITASAGLRDWRASVFYNGREIGSVRRADTGGPAIDAGVVMRDLRQQPSAVLSAELFVEDSAGRVAVARDTMRVLPVSPPAGNLEGGVQRSVSRYFLAEESGKQWDATIERIIAAVAGSATVRIASPHTAKVAGIETAVRDAARRHRKNILIETVPAAGSGAATGRIELTVYEE